ncbi:ABC transporter ATP-binding protein [Candidatus Bipolaricaulota bacterium]
MARPVITVDRISKKYRIGHRKETYRTLRDALADAAKAPLRRIRNFGQASHRTEDEIWALRDVSFEVKQGEVLGVIGRNGSGKSTLLKILSRITEPTTGRAEIRGRVGSLLEVGTGFHPELTGRENVYLSGNILGMRKSEIDWRFDEIVDFSGVEKFIDTPVKRYSSGMAVRLGFAVAAHLEPEILLIDEVLAVGDAAFQKKCLGRMRDVAMKGRIVLFVSHNTAAIQRLCSRAVLLSDGAVLLDGAVSETVSTYLSEGQAQSGERVWRDSERAPGNAIVRLRAVRVRDEDDQIRTTFTVRDPIFLEAEYEVLQERPLDAYYYLSNETAVSVLVSLDNKDSPWANGARPKGVYRSTCCIPGDFLNTGLFSASFVVSQNSGGSAMHLEEKDAVRFVVSDSLDEEGVRGGFGGQWPNTVIRPRLQWTVERIHG